MSIFRAVNVEDDEGDAEDHTKELQIEEGFRIFYKALNLQKDAQLQEAEQLYNQLFSLNIMQSETPTISPVIRTLNYLAYRNRGILRLHILQFTAVKSKPTDTLHDELLSLLTLCLKDLVKALEYEEGDSFLTQLLYDIFMMLDYKRIARYIVEYELMKWDNQYGSEDELPVSKYNISRGQLQDTLSLYDFLLQKFDDNICDSGFISNNHIQSFERVPSRKRKRANSIISSISSCKLNPSNRSLFSIDQKHSFKLKPSSSWGLLLSNIEVLIPKSKGKTKCLDDYLLTDFPMERVGLEAPNGDGRDLADTECSDDELVYRTPDPPDYATSQDASKTKLDNSCHKREESHEKERSSSNEEHMINPEASSSNSAALEEEHRTHSRNKKGNENRGNLDVVTSPNFRGSLDAPPTQSEAQKFNRSSRSRRNIDSLSVVVAMDDFAHNTEFIKSCNIFLALCPGHIQLFDNTEALIDEKLQSRRTDVAIPIPDIDFVSILNNWTQNCSALLLLNIEMEGFENFSVIDILSSTSINDFDVAIRNFNDLPMVETTLKEFLAMIENRCLNVYQLKYLVLKQFFGHNDVLNSRIITDYELEKGALKSLRRIMDSVDVTLLNNIRSFLNRQDGSTIKLFEFYTISISFTEQLVNDYISLKMVMKTKKDWASNKSRYNELLNSAHCVEGRILNWSSIVRDIYFLLRRRSFSDVVQKYWFQFRWVQISYSQYSNDSSLTYARLLLSRLDKELKECHISIDTSYINNDHISMLSSRNAGIQLSKLNVLNLFSSIIDNSVDNASTRIEMLESLLVQRSPVAEEYCELNQFIHGSSIELKLKLWQILLKHYFEVQDIPKYNKGYNLVIALLEQELHGEFYKNAEFLHRQKLLLRVLGFFGEFTIKFVSLLEQIKYSESLDPESMPLLATFVQLCVVVLVLEDFAQIYGQESFSRKSPRSFHRLSDILCATFCLFFLYWKSLLGAAAVKENINDFLSLLHKALGDRAICDRANGIFLKVLQRELLTLDCDDSDSELFQCFNCRFGVSLSKEKFSPFNHRCHHGPMSKDDALNISLYILPYIFNKKNPFLSPPRSDMKILLDRIHDVLGNPNIDLNDRFMINTAKIESFFNNMMITVKTLKYSFHGLLRIELQPLTEWDLAEVTQSGLYYLQGLTALNLFKVRKRSMQGRSAELGFVIKMLKNDLLCGNNRLETWLCLGQCYTFLFEDDVIWTSDKLNNENRKMATAVYQKKAILCYIMAINEYSRSHRLVKIKLSKGVSHALFSGFGKLLFGALVEPMNKLALLVNSTPLFVKHQGAKAYEKLSANNIGDSLMYKVLELSFQLAIRTAGDDWVNYYYLAKVQRKLGYSAHVVVRTLLLSCKVSSKKSTEVIIEPHYKLVSLLFKFVLKEQKLTVAEGSEYLGEDPVVSTLGKLVECEDDFARQCLQGLSKLNQIDKRNWQHKPLYRSARIRCEIFNDFQGAKKEMLALVNLKAHSKALVSIWKPENEIPGKHFVYNYTYVIFFVDILFELEDINSMITLCKKLRKIGQNLVQPSKAWDHACTKLCILVRKYCGMDEKYTEKALAIYHYGELLEKKKLFLEDLSKTGIIDFENRVDYYLLFEMSEFRRMTNGFAPTGMVDDTFFGIYLKIFQEWERRKGLIEVNTEEVKKYKPKVAKRDILPLCSELLKLVSKDLVSLKPQDFDFELRLNSGLRLDEQNHENTVSLLNEGPEALHI
ncbi:HIR complex subunit [Komagataella phaffii CBS 7435]|uniref:HIR complex subunit n=1 Tax=Komagataella phaffii (strain ATCC 76273 / CBS 7435 / CECT 11047 / NRRL Y-11430 / Wegner 21-1) TaxID=981350 RepID=F2QRY1_KOMPC|nr:GQ67_00874T0 [Komagataella phaffii]AOA67467.1 GQ68_00515T0 [Komagataella phaffii GS115]CAH2448003.1 Hir3p [Komagataella phaffii CBS 7435]CCA38159.1 HIR complex subunit [Komagataella phaffii CBS 7435]